MIKVRKILKQKTGYIGTLDPFATGVLPIAIGEAKKFIRFMEKSDKKYIFTTVFGSTTDTLDKTGTITDITKIIPNKNDVESIIHKFIGDIDQIPPIYSAIKINGKRACDRVRNGEHISLKKKTIKVFSLEIVDENLEQNEMTFEVSCSQGTYVRSLARDMAGKLGSLCYVKDLRRTKSGFFSIENAISLEKLLEIVDTQKVSDFIVSLQGPLDDIPALYLGSDEVAKLHDGLCISHDSSVISSSNVKIFDGDGVFHGVGFVLESGKVKAVRMCVR
jgi:tRNA pseudouridine55 synthase